MSKTRVAILGGGPAALATAFELTRTPELRAQYDIDLYQIGWRLGGKCASARNRSARGRNEEHGLHILGGFYHNVFDQLRPLYAEWAQVSPATAIPFDDAFVGHNTFTLMQPDGAGWRAVCVQLPTNDKVPGVDPQAVTPAEMLNTIVGWLAQALRQLASGQPPAPWLAAVEGFDPPPATPELSALADRGEALASAMPDQLRSAPVGDLLDRIGAHALDIQAAMQSLGQATPPKGPDWIGVLELVATITRGFAVDGLAVQGFDIINDVDASAWLRRHGGSDRAVSCPLFQAGYHYSFAFEDGDSTRPNIAAGVGMRGLLRMVFAYHGSVFMHMAGGMGEIVAAPYYEVLKARGVRFNFFHRVELLEPGADGRLAQVRMRVQGHPEGGPDAYRPLIDHLAGAGARPRRAWPEAPLFEQLLDGAALSGGPDLEKWIDSEGVGETLCLQADRDFDICVAAMSIGTLREIAAPLAGVSPAWSDMLASAGVTPTIAAQIWRREPVDTYYGVRQDGLMTGYVGPHDTWGDMSFLAALEQADAAGDRPASLSYLCGPITSGVGNPDRPDRPGAATQAWVANNAVHIFPGLADAGGGYRLDGELERYVRINDDPIDLYVCSPAGAIDKRIRPEGSGFANLFLAGDWTRNNFDCGAVETAVLSAKLCARAICGEPTVIYGESDLA
ncbi:MAG TPA: NAD(P)-binding protein [Caulobacteraceae bacterium]|nr:NAD(P)-binding protein [Caulobacteraceae bacterium]